MQISDYQGYVFIVTYGRSGSTVLQKVLQSIDGYFVRGENNHTLYALFDAHRRAFEARHKHGTGEPQADNPWYGADLIRPARFSTGLCEVFLREIIQPPADARIVGFKEIRFHEAGEEQFENYLNFIANKFPGTKFIFNTRNWEAVSKSSWWATMNPERVREIVETCDRMYANYALKHPGYCHQMKYEDFSGNAEAFRGLYEFLGETFDLAKVEGLISQRLKHAENVPGNSTIENVSAV